MQGKPQNDEQRTFRPINHRLALNSGQIEARTLAECLGVDFGALMAAVVSDLPKESHAAMAAAQTIGITQKMRIAATLLLGHPLQDTLRHHPSDTVRGWACFLVALTPDMPLLAQIKAMKPLADDPHFGVREWAWLALRPAMAADIHTAIAALVPWTASPSERVRRFASEALRPRGVWSAHIAELKQDPTLGFPLLELLRADPSRYVQNSVGNWLNDAAKSAPAPIQDLCKRWQYESPTPATDYICNRALRSIKRTS